MRLEKVAGGGETKGAGEETEGTGGGGRCKWSRRDKERGGRRMKRERIKRQRENRIKERIRK
jgi:hypothetical protein